MAVEGARPPAEMSWPSIGLFSKRRSSSCAMLGAAGGDCGIASFL
jgi:hypothetical protein